MLYPPLEEGHQVLGQEYCSGFSDVHGKWNTGFYCPPIIPDVPVFCCGTIILKYCCTLGKPVPGGYSKGYDGRHSDHDEEEHENDDNAEDELDERIIPEIPIQSSGEVDFNQKSLLIGIICGLVAMAALMTVVSCFYCSCCLLYKKRRGRQLGGGIYGIPTSSSTTTTCGLLNSFGNATPAANAAIITSTNNNQAGGGVSSGGGICSSSGGGVNTTVALPNFINTSTPLVDYWNSTTGGGSSNSSSCGVASGGGASSTLIVAATATSLPPQNHLVGGHAPHHIHHGSVYHHHHHYTTSTPIVGPPGGALPFLHMDPPPPYLAVASQQQGLGTDSTGSVAVPIPITPQRTNSTGGQNANLLIQRQLSLLQNHQHVANNSNVINNNNTANLTSSPGNNNPVEGGSNGNSPSISAGVTSPRATENTHSRTGGRGSLPPPYFVEQYRIRNRVRPPPFLTNPESGATTRSNSNATTNNNRNQRNRAQETIHNLLYPLLNSAALTSASSRHARRGNSNTAATDTQSEPRRSHHHHSHVHHSHSHHHNRNTGGGCPERGVGLHRSSSDRQQGCVSTTARCCYMAGERGGCSGGEGVVAMNNLINNLSVRSGRRTASETSSTTTPGRQAAISVGGGSGDIRRSRRTSGGGHSDENDGNLAVDNMGKILNTQVLQHAHEREGHLRQTNRDYQNSSNSPTTAASIALSIFRPDCSTQVNSRLLPRFQQHECGEQSSSNLGQRDVFGRNENERRTLAAATPETNDNADMDDDIIMMEDEEDEVIAVVTTAHHHQHHHHQVGDDDEEEVEAVVVDIMDDLGFGVEEYLVEDENSEENSTDKLSESAPNSSMSVSADATHNSHPAPPHHNQNNGNDDNNSKRGTESPSSFLAEGENGQAATDDDHDHHHHSNRKSDNRESRDISGEAPAVTLVGFVSDKES